MRSSHTLLYKDTSKILPAEMKATNEANREIAQISQQVCRLRVKWIPGEVRAKFTESQSEPALKPRLVGLRHKPVRIEKRTSKLDTNDNTSDSEINDFGGLTSLHCSWVSQRSVIASR